MTLKTLADVKRLPVGTELYCVRNHKGPCRLYRKLEKVQTNAWAYSGDGIEPGKRGWTHFPKKAADVECEANRIRFYYDRGGKYEMFIEYEVKQ